MLWSLKGLTFIHSFDHRFRHYGVANATFSGIFQSLSNAHFSLVITAVHTERSWLALEFIFCLTFLVLQFFFFWMWERGVEWRDLGHTSDALWVYFWLVVLGSLLEGSRGHMQCWGSNQGWLSAKCKASALIFELSVALVTTCSIFYSPIESSISPIALSLLNLFFLSLTHWIICILK